MIGICESAQHWDHSTEVDLPVLCVAELQHGLHDRESDHDHGDDGGGGLHLHLLSSMLSVMHDRSLHVPGGLALETPASFSSFFTPPS